MPSFFADERFLLRAKLYYGGPQMCDIGYWHYDCMKEVLNLAKLT